MLRPLRSYIITSSKSVLSPQILLSTESRKKFTRNMLKLSSFGKDDGKLKSNAAVLVPVVVANEEVSLIYTLRSSKLKTHGGHISFPGGKAESGETPPETALRETQEELGIPISDVDIWAVMPKFIAVNRGIAIIPVVGVIKNFDLTKLKPNIGEVREVYVVPIKSLIDKLNRGYVKHENYQLPLYNCPETGAHKIWGISGFITNLFLTSLLPEHVYDPDFTNFKPYDRETLLKQAKS